MTANPNLPPSQLDPGLVNLLNYLIKLNINSQTTYQTAVAHLRDAQYRALLTTYAEQRGQFADQLRKLMYQEDENPTKMGTLTGIVQEGLLNLQAAFGSGDGAILAHCAREDEAAISGYQDAFGQITEEPLLAVLRPQFTDIRNAYERVKALSVTLNR